MLILFKESLTSNLKCVILSYSYSISLMHQEMDGCWGAADTMIVLQNCSSEYKDNVIGILYFASYWCDTRCKAEKN